MILANTSDVNKIITVNAHYNVPKMQGQFHILCVYSRPQIPNIRMFFSDDLAQHSRKV